jgi:hypothetical protein
VKPNVFSKEQALFREEDLKRLKELVDERVRRHWTFSLMAGEGIEEEQVTALMQSGIPSIEQALIQLTKQHVATHRAGNNMGLARNSMMHLGNIHERIGEHTKALKYYLRVCFYDLNGANNSGGVAGFPCFNPETAFLAPGIIGWISKLMEDLHLNTEQMHQLFLSEAKQVQLGDMLVNPETVWRQLFEALFPAADG